MANPSGSRLQAKVVAKAMRNAAFRRQLLKSPHKALAAEGIEIPAGVRVRVVENSPKRVYLVLPSKPKARKAKAGGPKAPPRMGAALTFG